MGYTHYFYQKRSMTEDEFSGWKSDVARLLQALPATVAEFESRYAESPGMDSDKPLAVEPQGAGRDPGSVMGAGAVGFNGAGFDDADHETFWVPREIDAFCHEYQKKDIAAGQRFHFTKTARKPYDAMVVACLLALKRRAPSAWSISSDGEVEDWAPGCRFAVEALGLRSLPLAAIGDFRKDKEGLAAARALTADGKARVEAAREARVLEASTRKRPAPGRKSAL